MEERRTCPDPAQRRNLELVKVIAAPGDPSHTRVRGLILVVSISVWSNHRIAEVVDRAHRAQERKHRLVRCHRKCRGPTWRGLRGAYVAVVPDSDMLRIVERVVPDVRVVMAGRARRHLGSRNGPPYIVQAGYAVHGKAARVEDNLSTGNG